MWAGPGHQHRWKLSLQCAGPFCRACWDRGLCALRGNQFLQPQPSIEVLQLPQVSLRHLKLVLLSFPLLCLGFSSARHVTLLKFCSGEKQWQHHELFFVSLVDSFLMQGHWETKYPQSSLLSPSYLLATAAKMCFAVHPIFSLNFELLTFSLKSFQTAALPQWINHKIALHGMVC